MEDRRHALPLFACKAKHHFLHESKFFWFVATYWSFLFTACSNTADKTDDALASQM